MDKGDWKRRGTGPFPEPGSPRLPSPAWHLSRPDNGTSRAEHALCVPAHQTEGEQGIPGGDSGQPGGKRGSGLGAERNAGPRSKRGTQQ